MNIQQEMVECIYLRRGEAEGNEVASHDGVVGEVLSILHS